MLLWIIMVGFMTNDLFHLLHRFRYAKKHEMEFENSEFNFMVDPLFP